VITRGKARLPNMPRLAPDRTDSHPYPPVLTVTDRTRQVRICHHCLTLNYPACSYPASSAQTCRDPLRCTLPLSHKLYLDICLARSPHGGKLPGSGVGGLSRVDDPAASQTTSFAALARIARLEPKTSCGCCIRKLCGEATTLWVECTSTRRYNLPGLLDDMPIYLGS
jgi:hypothetical protein